MIEKIENKDLCSACGGVCCKKCGCDYSPLDFEEMSINYLQSKLNEGKISIVSTLFFDTLKNGQMICLPFLYLRVRNVDRPIVDLISMKTGCSLLNSNGCPYDYDSRPTGAKNLVPDLKAGCYPLVDPHELIVEPWIRYQKILSRLVKRMTGNSVDAQISMDVEKLFCDIRDGNFNNVGKHGLEEIMQLIPFLSEVYVEEFNRVMQVKKGDVVVKLEKMHVLLKKVKSKIQ